MSAALILIAPVVSGCGETPSPPQQSGSASEGAAVPSADPAAPDAAASSPAGATAAPHAEGAVDDAVSLHFTDVTQGSGLIATITSGELPSSQILEVKGGGLALIDFDGDGDQDVFVPNGATLDDPERGPGARLFENLGGMRFRDITDASGIGLRRWSFGTAVADFDGDGREDIFICCFGPDVLLRNLGDGRFEDVTQAAGIVAEGWSTSAAFADLDGDGDLDLYVVRYLDFDVNSPPGPTIFKSIPVMSGPVGLPATVDLLFENLGDGTFREVGEAAGIRSVPASYGLNAAILDFDGDGRPDIFVGNDSRSNFLFTNRSGTTTAAQPGETRLRFEDRGMTSGIATNFEGGEQATMGIGIADVNGDSRPDVFTTNFSSDTNTLHVNGERGFFSDRTQQYGLGAVSRPYLGWACGFFDFDHDGDEDLMVFNGHVYPQASKRTMDSEYEQPPLLFERVGRRFERAASERAGAWLAEAQRDRAAVFADLDGDGDIDVVVGELNGPLRLLRNDTVERASRRTAAVTPITADSTADITEAPESKDLPAGRWLIVELDDQTTPGNRRGIGAIIECRVGDLAQRRWIWAGGPFMSNAAAMAHFGFPESAGADEIALTVTWPDGEIQTIDGVPSGRRMTVVRSPQG